MTDYAPTTDTPVSVREATFSIWKRLGMTTIFSNPGSTEVPLLRDLPSEFNFILGLHEASVVGMATGFALSAERPALALLHTTADLGNAVGAIATARVNRAPLVVVVGQEDRRHLIHQPFLKGELRDMAGTYPVWLAEPAMARDVPSLIARAWYEAKAKRGPALVIVPMNDWDQDASPNAIAAPIMIETSVGGSDNGLAQLIEMIRVSANPAIVVGADADSRETWETLTQLAEKLACPVWQEPFGARAGYPQDHHLFRGHLPSGKSRLRTTLAGHDLLLVVGAPAFRQYPYEPGPFVNDGTRIAIISENMEVATSSTGELAVIGPIADLCLRLVDHIDTRNAQVRKPHRIAPPIGRALRAGNVFATLADRISPDTLIIEESPSSRFELQERLPARHPFSFLSAAMGGLGFAMPAAIGVRIATPRRPVIAIVGDGSSMYSFQAIWSAVHYHVGVIFVIMNNGSYSIMDRLAEQSGYSAAVWPTLESIDICKLAEGFGCTAHKVATKGELEAILDRLLPSLDTLNHPVLLDVSVESDLTFEPCLSLSR
ncbi:MAG: thiamine pyrophosphate-binding protein [Actinomycetota bacterium]|nr:thiamine pyrophosphate-binding protein [Actinomycetota bacterium]